MKKINSKYFPILLLVFLDFVSVLLSVYFSASFIQINFIPYLNLFFYYSFLFFIIVFFINFYFGNYTYLNRSFAIDNIKSLIYGSILIFVILYIFKNIFEFNNINLYFWDNYFLSIKNIFNQTVLFCLLSIISRIVVSRISLIIVNRKINNNDLKEYILYGAGRSGLALLDNIKNNNFTKPQFIIDDDPSKIGRYVY